jgi:hypothetical protein
VPDPWAASLCPGSSGPGRAHDDPELVQPLMVVVLVVIARAAVHAGVAEAVFRANGRAANIMGNHCSGRAHWRVSTFVLHGAGVPANNTKEFVMWMGKSFGAAMWLALCGAVSACAANDEGPRVMTPSTPTAPGEAAEPTAAPGVPPSQRYPSPYRDPEAAQQLIDQYKEGIGRRASSGRL